MSGTHLPVYLLTLADRLYLDPQEPIRFRVEKTEWQEKEPLPPSVRDKPPEMDEDGNPIVDDEEEDPIEKARFKVVVSTMDCFVRSQLTYRLGHHRRARIGTRCMVGLGRGRRR